MNIDEFIAQFPPELRSRMKAGLDKLFADVKETTERSIKFIDLAAAEDWSDQQLWSLLAFMKGAMRHAGDETGHSSCFDQVAWNIFETYGYNISKAMAAEKAQAHAAAEALARAPAAGKA